MSFKTQRYMHGSRNMSYWFLEDSKLELVHIAETHKTFRVMTMSFLKSVVKWT